MPTGIAPSLSILSHAESELAAFLQAVTSLAGPGSILRACDIWIEMLQDAECPNAELTRFFRNVTIRAASQLATLPGTETLTKIDCSWPPLDICA